MDSLAEERTEVSEPKPNRHIPPDQTVPLAPSCPCPQGCCLNAIVASVRMSPKQKAGERTEVGNRLQPSKFHRLAGPWPTIGRGSVTWGWPPARTDLLTSSLSSKPQAPLSGSQAEAGCTMKAKSLGGGHRAASHTHAGLRCHHRPCKRLPP